MNWNRFESASSHRFGYGCGLEAGSAYTRRDGTKGSLLRSGVHVVLAGRPNVGKSSLLNRLAGEERAIVTPVPGTTRDALRETIQIEGVPIVVVDTAGLHASPDEIEQIGMERARSEMARADLVLLVLDAVDPVPPADLLPTAGKRITVVNKIDLVPGMAEGKQGDAIHLSAKTGTGLDALRVALLEAAAGAGAFEPEARVEGQGNAGRRPDRIPAP